MRWIRQPRDGLARSHGRPAEAAPSDARCVSFGVLLGKAALTSTLRSLPMPEKTPEVFRFLPEYLIEDITNFLSFTSK